MSNRALNWAFDAPIANGGAKFVLVVLADHASDHDGEDWVCFPSMNRLADATSQCSRSIERHLKWLVGAGWISRRRRILRKREASVYEYTLHRHKGAQPPAKSSGGQAPPPPDNLSPTTRQSVVIPPHPPYIAEPSGTPTDARATQAAFQRLFSGWKSRSPGRLSPVAARRAFAAAALRCDPTRIAEAGERYLALDPDVNRLKTAIRLHTWLDDDRFEPWLAAGDPPAILWRGPPAIRDAIVMTEGEDFAASFLDRARWDAGRRAILAATGVAAERLKRLGAGRLAALGVELIEKGV